MQTTNNNNYDAVMEYGSLIIIKTLNEFNKITNIMIYYKNEPQISKRTIFKEGIDNDKIILTDSNYYISYDYKKQYIEEYILSKTEKIQYFFNNGKEIMSKYYEKNVITSEWYDNRIINKYVKDIIDELYNDSKMRDSML